MLLLVRHGETSANASGRLSGRGEVALTPTGREQVVALAAAVGPVARLVSSPLGRAVETAEGLGVGVVLRVDPRWTEIDYGELEGRPLSEVPAELWRGWREDPALRPPGGESLSDVSARVVDACQELFGRSQEGARDEHGAVVVVSHVSPIKAAVAWALGCREHAVWRMHLSTGSITAIGWSGGAPVLHAYNWRPDGSPPWV